MTVPVDISALEWVPAPLLGHRGGLVTYANARASALLGAASPEAVVGTPLAQWLVRPDAQQALCSPGDGIEVDLLRGDGRAVPVLASTETWQHSGGLGWISLLKDMTLRRLAEEDRARFFALAIDMHGVVEGGRYARVNPEFTRSLGWTEQELLGQLTTDLIHPDDLPRALAARQTVMAGVKVSHFEVRLQRKDGTYCWVSAHSVPAADGRRYITLRDMTQAKEAEATLLAAKAEAERARADAEQANQAKSAFLAAMSHEIRTPMNGVIGMAEVLGQTPMPEDQADAVRTIRDSALSLLGLVDDILDFSKIEAGKVDLERVPYSLDQLVEGLCASLGAVAARAGVDLSLFVDPSLPERLVGDPTRVRQVISNFVGNAIKFSGGRADVRGQVSVRVEPAPGDRLRVLVTDNGIGIDPAVTGMLFTRFTQAEASTTRRFGGTGLGLAICARLVQLMGGDIGVESELGQGARFWATLPLVGAGGGRRPVALRGVHVAIVDASPMPVSDVCAWLDAAGAKVDVLDAEPTADRPLPEVTVLVRPELVVTVPHPVERQVVLVSTRSSSGSDPFTGQRPQVVDLDNLRRHVLLYAVSVAAGLSRPAAPAPVRQEVGPRPAPPTIAEARARGQLILVAEDNVVNQKVILRQLALLGMTAEVAATGPEALELWRHGSYALLLTDLHMPGLDGYELTEVIRREERERHRFLPPGAAAARPERMPIVALTANALRGEANRARAVGMDDYLTKPLLLGQLKAALRRWVPGAPATVPPGAPGAAGGADVGVVDLAQLRRFVGDDPDVLRDVLTEFAASIRSLTASTEAAVKARDGRGVAGYAHQLKSGCSTVGAFALRDVCIELENAAALGDPAVMLERWCDFQLGVGPVLAAIEHHLGVTAKEGGR